MDEVIAAAVSGICIGFFIGLMTYPVMMTVLRGLANGA